MGTYIAIAMLDNQIARAVKDLVDALYALDANIAHLGLRLPDEQELVRQGLADYWEDVRNLEERINRELMDIAIRAGSSLSGIPPNNS